MIESSLDGFLARPHGLFDAVTLAVAIVGILVADPPTGRSDHRSVEPDQLGP